MQQEGLYGGSSPTNKRTPPPEKELAAHDGNTEADAESEEDLFRDEDEEYWKRRAWAKFSRLATRGAINSAEFFDFAQSMNIECDVPTLRRVIPKDQWQRITFDVAVKALDVIPTLELEEEHEQEGAQYQTTGDGTLGTAIAKVGLREYIWRVWLCGEKEPGVQYELDSKSVVSPRFWLIFNAAVVFIMISGAILGFISYLWLQNAEEREGVVLRQLEETLKLIIRAITENSLETAGHDLEDQVVTLSRWLEQLYRLEQEELQSSVWEDHARDIEFALHAAENVAALRLAEMSERLAVLARFSSQVLLEPATILALVHGFVQKTQWEVAVFNMHTFQLQWTSIEVGSIAFTGAKTPLCWTELKERRSGQAKGTGLLGEPAADLVYQYLPTQGFGVCLSLNKDAAASLVRADLVHKIDETNHDTESFHLEEVVRLQLAGPIVNDEWNSTSQSHTITFDYLSEQRLPQTVCGQPGKAVPCNALKEKMKECYNQKELCYLNRTTLPYYNIEEGTHVISYLPWADAVLVHTRLFTTLNQKVKDRLIRFVDTINSRLTDSTLELVVAGRDPSGMHIIPQQTGFKFLNDCYVNCERIPESVEEIIGTFQTEGHGYGLYPDYRPAPIIGGFSYVLENFNSSLIIERDVTEQRTLNLNNLIDAVDHINEHMDDTTELMLFRQKGFPVAEVFDPQEPCAANTICTYGGELGILARSDCADCLRKEQGMDTSPYQYLTPIRFPERCDHCNVSNDALPGAHHDMVEEILRIDVTAGDENSQHHKINTEIDYGEIEVTSFFAFFPKLRTYLIVKRDVKDYMDPVMTSIATLVGVASGVVLLGVFGLIFLSRRVLNRIEAEWSRYKDSIDREKNRFDLMMKEIVPASVLMRFHRGQKAVAESHPSVSYILIDVCGFSEYIREKPPRVPVRITAYYNILFHSVARGYSLFRLKSYGDASLFVSGLEKKMRDFTAYAQSAYNAACFATTLLQLLSKTFAHYPQRIPAFRDCYATDQEREEPLYVLPLRVGLHAGPTMSGLVDTGSTPLYEHYGNALSLTHRLQATCQPGRAHASGNFKELVESVDATNSFEFDTLRKTMVKGKGTITSYPIRSAQLAINDFILKKLRIEYADQMYQFQFKRGQKVGDGTTSYTKSDSHSGGIKSGSGGSGSVGSGSASDSHSHVSTDTPH